MDLCLKTWKTHHGLSSVSLITARGCSYMCTWCSHSVFGETHRRCTPVDVADEVAWIAARAHTDFSPNTRNRQGEIRVSV